MDELKLDRPRTTFCRRMARKAFRACTTAFPYGWPDDVTRAAGIVLPGFLVFDLEQLPDGVSAIVDIQDRSIGVNATHPRPRQRFAVAHEIGHACLNHPLYVFAGSGRQDAILEQEADVFAREFLMPLATLKHEFRTCRDYEALAQRFEVEREVMYYRFRETGLWRQVM